MYDKLSDKLLQDSTWFPSERGDGKISRSLDILFNQIKSII
ncbi:hypothetical protein C4K37_4289 [Pseudomonas chlororaphis subsp. piscium]|nr:hypothetical protein C4K37_4289 [Pseudomonas chlororaphis subsp. piscium]AZC45218.1 hypothetical protein C4K36_4301 [Pseudomonas chlororaphis subsp. piscium]